MKFVLLLLFSTAFLTGQNVLHYDETTGYDHNTRDASFSYFQSLGDEQGFQVTQDSDGSEFTMSKMQNYDLVIFSNTSGNSGLSGAQQAALEWFIDVKGGGLVGIHAASDTYRHSSANGGSTGTWDWYAETLGGSVQTSPNHTSQNHVNDISEITASPATSNLILPWTKEEEYYYWENGYLNSDITELLRVGDTGGNTYDDPRPVAWQRTNNADSRIFYTSLGHKKENFYTSEFSQFQQLLKDATIWALAANQTVPVNLVNFETTLKNSRFPQVELSWVTSTEHNADYFEILRSTNLETWNSLGVIDAIGNSTNLEKYQFTDRKPLPEFAYYRLKQVDFNGNFEYSPTRRVELINKLIFRALPNPTSSKTTIAFNKAIPYGELQIYDVNGSRMKRQIIKNTQTIAVELSDFPSGIYFAVMEIKGIRHRLKLIKL